MTITEAFKAIQADESLCARRVGGEIYYCFEHGTLCVFQVVDVRGHRHRTDPSQYANKKGQESFSMLQIFSDYELIPISSL